MTKHHKKPSPEQQKKLQTAQNRNDFFRRFEQLVNLIAGNNETYKSMSQKTLNEFYLCRMRSPRIEAATGMNIDPFIIDQFRAFSIPQLKSTEAVFNEYGDTITLYDYLTVGLTLFLFAKTIGNQFEKTAPGFMQKVADIAERIGETNSVAIQANHLVSLYAAYISDFTAKMYWVDIDFIDDNNSILPTLHASFKISYQVLEKEAIVINGKNHPSVKLGWPFYPNGMEYCMLSPELFGLPQNDKTNLLPVYIQLHALQRITERMDCVSKNLININIYSSLVVPIVHAAHKGYFFIEYQFNKMKAGYFVASIHNNKVLLHTFLFLTNNGTPEGKKLEELTGIQKLDKIYLSLDKLSTFVDPELSQNETIRRLFIDAGCGGLFDIAETGLVNTSNINSNVGAETLMKYLKLMPVDASEPPDFSDAFTNARYKNFS